MIGDGFISSQLMITSYDGITFDNLADKKTIISPISDNSIGSEVNTRDPKVWRGKDAWYMILGSTIENAGRFLFYKSSDLEKWEYVNFCEKSDFGWMWECPDYFEVDNRGVVIFSPIGILDDGLMYDSAAVCCLADFDEKSCTMKLADEYFLEIYVDSNLIEVFVNDGEYVISSVVYGLSDKIAGKNFTVYSAE